MLLSQMLASADIIDDLSHLLEECYQAFEEIFCISSNKKSEQDIQKDDGCYS